MLRKDVNVLIVAYRRKSNIRRLIEFCLSQEVAGIYITLDGPKSQAGIEDFNEIVEMIKFFRNAHNCSIYLLKHDVNVGCAVNVIIGCNWFFSKVKWGIVIEDDCFPTADFLTFSIDNINLIQKRNDLLLLCGTQFYPQHSIDASSYFSKYALTWGWATTSEKWNFIYDIFFKVRFRTTFLKGLFSSDRHYWRAAMRRAYSGYTDVWDSILVCGMQELKFYALLPAKNLVRNIGFDDFSLHTKKQSIFMNFPVGNYNQLDKLIEYSSQQDEWLRKYFYKIRFRHFFTTKLTFFIDLFMLVSRKKLFKLDLNTRLTIKH